MAADISARLTNLNVQLLDDQSKVQPDLHAVLDLYKERASTLNELAESIVYFYKKPVIDAAAAEKHLTDDIQPAMLKLAELLSNTAWNAEAIHHVIAEVVAEFQLKFPKVAMPLRVLMTGIAQSPSIDQVMALLTREEVLARIAAFK